MTKNIAVLDENGNQIGTTYPKRAKGLVKSGRAVYSGENAVRFCRPPSAVKAERTETKMNDINIREILTKIEWLLSEKDHILKAYETIEKSNEPWKADAAAGVAADREKTVQKALDFYISLSTACGLTEPNLPKPEEDTEEIPADEAPAEEPTAQTEEKAGIINKLFGAHQNTSEAK